jgi:hypothetical protein
VYHHRSWKLNLHTTETTTGDPASGPVVEIWRTIRSYILWSYERGTIQYDVMVTLILLFVLLSPRWINFNDKPIERNPHPIGVIVTPDAGGGFIYQIEGVAVSAKDDEAIHDQLLAIIEPISGGVTISKVEPIRDKAGRILSYRVWAQKE